MANTINGKILVIGPTVELPTKSGNSFLKRQLVLDCSHDDIYTGNRFENYPSFSFLQRNTALLDAFKAGDIVTVTFGLNGRIYQKDGVNNYFTDVVGFHIDKIDPTKGSNSAQSTAPSQSPTPHETTSPNVNNAAQQGSNDATHQFPPQVNAKNDDDLPF